MKGFQAKVTKGYFVNPGNGTIRNDFNKEVQHFCTSKRTFLSKRTEAQKDLKLIDLAPNFAQTLVFLVNEAKNWENSGNFGKIFHSFE